MSLTGQQSSSRRKEKGPMEPLTPLQEKELENDSLRRQVHDFQQEIHKLRTRNENLEADQMAKNKVIERLSNDLSRRELEIDSWEELNAQLQGLLEDISQERYEKLRAANDRYRSDLADARKIIGKDFGDEPLELAAITKPLTKERANAEVATEPLGKLISSSDEEEEQRPDASVQPGFAAATSQTRGEYWPRGIL